MKFNIIATAISKHELKVLLNSLNIDKINPTLYAAMLEVFNTRIAQLKKEVDAS